ncbi:MAG: hypothetical protein ASARMPREDX12_001971 [Alectoria sarmentosa]|nr:MAG: hypothetical protein ASARMPREDX12_001971 [Alectoria sarmentosa]
MASSISLASNKGFQDASSYDKHRPSYPPEAVARFLEHLQVSGVKGARIVDLAAGTGKFTELLVGRHEDFEILAMEPNSGMRKELEKKQLMGVKVLEGEAIRMAGVESQSVDAVIVAQAFHWFANKNALEEIYRVLSPSGAFGMIWNIEDYNAPMSWKPTAEWEGKLKDITWSFGNEDVRFRHEQWRKVFETQLEITPFSIQAADPLFSLPLGENSVEFNQSLSPDAIWDRYHTLSQFAVLEGQELAIAMGPAPQKRSLFNKPSWSRPQALSNDTELFHRSNQTYVDLAAEAERARKRKQARKDRDRARQNVIGERAGKRRRVSEDEDEDEDDEDDDSSSDESSSHSSHKEIKTGPTQSKHHRVPSSTSLQKPIRSPKSLLQNYEAEVAASKVGQEQKQKQKPMFSDIIDLEDEEDSSILIGQDSILKSTFIRPTAPPEDDQPVSDEEFPELARQAREMARRKRLAEDIASTAAIPQNGQSSLHQRMPPTSQPDPILQILITSSIDNTTPLIVSRRLSQRLKDARLAWAKRQNFTTDFTGTVFLTWRGKRVFDVTTCRSLGITVDPIGRLSTKEGSWEEEEGQVHMEAMTAKILEAHKKAKRNAATSQEDSAAQEEAVAAQDHGAEVRIVLKTKGLDDFKLQVRPSTLVSKIVNAFRCRYQIGGEKDVFLSFDGERLSPDSRIDETELSDMDALEVIGNVTQEVALEKVHTTKISGGAAGTGLRYFRLWNLTSVSTASQIFNMAIQKIHARYVYDSRGNPTVEVDLVDSTGLHRSIVPRQHEACELRDGDKSKWAGKGVLKAVANVNEILGPAVIKEGFDVTDQAKVDEFLNKLDGTKNKTKLGANAILGVSLAVAKAGAAKKNVPLYAHISDLAGTKKPYVLPVPFMNVLNGGSHAGGRLAFQEFMIVPAAAPSFSEAMRQGSEVYQLLKSLAKKKYGQSAGNVGDEGGVAPDIQTAEEALDLITEAIEKAGYKGQVKIAMDVASSEFYKEDAKKYDLDFKNPDSDKSKWITYEQLADMYKSLASNYPIVSIEDPFAEDDWEAWSYFYKTSDFQIVGDDLTVTNPEFIKKAIELKSCNALLLKVNQIGTLTESIQAAKDAYSAGWGLMVSHRSGETEDVTIADIAVGLRCGQIKTGAPARSERLAKLNQILRIEEELSKETPAAVFAGEKFRTSFENCFQDRSKAIAQARMNMIIPIVSFPGSPIELLYFPNADEDSEDESSSDSSPPAIVRRSKFDDEEDDSDVLDSWDAADDSEVEREKAKKVAEAKAKADAEAAANKKSKAQRIEEKRVATMRRKAEEEEESSSEEEDEATARARLRQTEQDSDLKHAEDMFGNIGINKNRSATNAMVIADPSDPSSAIDLSSLPLFNPNTKDQFLKLRETLTPILASNSKKAQYTLFMQEFAKQIVKDLPSDQIKKIASGLTTLSNEKMKEEKAAEKGGKKTKAAKSKATLVANRDTSFKADTTSYGADVDEEFSSKELRTVGNYTLGRLIGKGSFGKVYLASHKLTNGSKVVLKSANKDDSNLAREIHHHRQFLHPHIARLYEVIVTENLVWLVLEYCPGDELYNYLLRHGAIPVEKVQRIFTQLVGAVAYVHNLSCVHRDLKLENILLDKNENVKLCDFGFTREYEGKSSYLQTFCGTVCYSAPEMLKGERYAGEKIDVWSLGIILFALLTGELPFDDDDDMITKHKILSSEPSFPDNFPPDAKSLVSQLLSKRPLLRPGISDILTNSFLSEHAPQQQAILKLTQPLPFATNLEKETLERMRSAGVDIDKVIENVLAQRCDALAGWWALLIEKEGRKEKRREKKRREREMEAKNLRRLSAASSRLERIAAPLREVDEEGLSPSRSADIARSRGRRERRSTPTPFPSNIRVVRAVPNYNEPANFASPRGLVFAKRKKKPFRGPMLSIGNGNGGISAGRPRDSSVGGSRSASAAGRTSGEIIEEEDEDEVEEVDTFSPLAPEAEETIWGGKEAEVGGWVRRRHD